MYMDNVDSVADWHMKSRNKLLYLHGNYVPGNANFFRMTHNGRFNNSVNDTRYIRKTFQDVDINRLSNINHYLYQVHYD